MIRNFQAEGDAAVRRSPMLKRLNEITELGFVGFLGKRGLQTSCAARPLLWIWMEPPPTSLPFSTMS